MSTDKNIVISPYSVAEALSFLRGGARGATAAQLDAVLQGVGRNVDPAARAALRVALLKVFAPDIGMSVKIANSLWTAPQYPLTVAFADLATNAYAAKSASVDFGDSIASAGVINAWVKGATDGQITNLIPPSTLDALVRAVLVNAVSFHGKWLDAFDKAATAPAPFRLQSGRSVVVPTMHGSAAFTPSDALTTITLPYVSDYVMRIAVPTQSTVAGLDSAMADLARPRTRTDREACGSGRLTIPRWATRSSFDLLQPLKGLGINDVFDGRRSDLTGISPAAGADRLYVSAALHQATVTVDEDGTVAAAATALVARATSAEPNFGNCPDSVTVDRPFVYVIRHVATGQILFAGRVVDPFGG